MSSRKIFIVDTSVLLYDMKSIHSFEGNTVVIPVMVLDELDRFKDKHSLLGTSARYVNRLLDDLRAYGNLEKGINVSNLPNFEVDLSKVQTNMIYVQTKNPAAEVVKALAEYEIDAFDLTSDSIRLVTHLHITDEDVTRVMHAFGEI